jgi:hypothetical protein
MDTKRFQKMIRDSIERDKKIKACKGHTPTIFIRDIPPSHSLYVAGYLYFYRCQHCPLIIPMYHKPKGVAGE